MVSSDATLCRRRSIAPIGDALAVAAGAWPLAWTGFGLFLVLVGALVVGLIEARASRRVWLALAIAPWYVPWKAAIRVKALLSVRRGVKTYGATPR